jgi:hypothetical protein
LRASIFRNIGDALLASDLRRADPHAFAIEPDFARLGRRNPEHRLRELAAAGADEAGEANDLAGPHREADALRQPATHKIARFEDRRADRRLRFRKEIVDSPLDHHLHEFRGICVGDLSRSDERAVTQNGYAICDRENLVSRWLI